MKLLTIFFIALGISPLNGMESIQLLHSSRELEYSLEGFDPHGNIILSYNGNIYNYDPSTNQCKSLHERAIKCITDQPLCIQEPLSTLNKSN